MDSLERDFKFRVDPSALMLESGKPPDPWQVWLLRARAHRAICLVHRQGGKSTTYAAGALHRALYPKGEKGALVLIFAAAQRQAIEVERKVVEFYNAIRPAMEMEQASETRVMFANGSRIIALPATETTIVGFSAPELVILDEAARIQDILYASVRPMLAASDGDLWLCSTPFGKRGFFHREWTATDPTWLRVKQLAAECPRITAEFLAEEKRTYPEWWYRQEYECEFADTEGQALSYELVMGAMGGVDALKLAPPPDQPTNIIGGVEALHL